MVFSVTALNVANRRVLMDNSVTFGGFHYNAPARYTPSSATDFITDGSA